jgi:hypothetical protein
MVLSGVEPSDEDAVNMWLEDEENKATYDAGQIGEDLQQFNDENIMTLEEYEAFPHAIFIFRSAPNPDYLRSAYSKLAEHLKFEKTPDFGVTILLTETWMFIAPLTDPVTCVGGKPVFIDPLAYAGILNVNIATYNWPQTASHDLVFRTPIDLLKISSDPCKIPEPTVIEEPESEIEESEHEVEGEGDNEEGEGEEEE